MKIMLGLMVAVLCIAGGFHAMGGNIYILYQPFEYVIIVGAAVGAYIISNPVHVLKETVMGMIPGKIKGKKKGDFLELLSLMYVLLMEASKNGGNNLEKLEKDFDDPESSAIFNKFPNIMKDADAVVFICDYMRLLSSSKKNGNEINDLMEEEIETLRDEFSETPKAIQVMADGFPALGIIAAIMGMVKTMGYIDAEPAILGMMLGGALVGTATGIFLCYCVAAPISSSWQKKKDTHVVFYNCIRSMINAYLNGSTPKICIEFGRKVIISEYREDFSAIENMQMSIDDKALGR